MNNNSEKFEILISASDSYGGHCVEDAIAIYKNLDKEQVNKYINQVNNFNNDGEFDDSIMEDMSTVFDDMFKSWYEAHHDKYEFEDVAREYFDDGAGYTHGWTLDIDVFDSNNRLVNLEFDGDAYASI